MPVPAHSIRSRPARGGPPSARISRDPDILASHLEDASHFPGGHVDGLVVVPNGEVLDIERGGTRAGADGAFDIVLSDRTVIVPVPRYRMPDVPKTSAGYFAAPHMDLIDLFIGSEGTLGVITEITLRLVPVRPAPCLAFVPFADAQGALAFVRRLRDAARTAWRTGDPAGLDISAIEHMDARCLALLREDGVDRLHAVPIPDRAAIALLVTLELPPGTTTAEA